MNKRPGHVNVTVETGYCNFCGRTRNLRREEHQLGTLVRTIITCESCHRTLSSSVGVAAVEPEVVESPGKMETPVEAAAQPATKAAAQPATRAPAKANAPDKSRAKPKTAAARKPAAKPAGRAAPSPAKAKSPT